jgi:hypothetical protein
MVLRQNYAVVTRSNPITKFKDQSPSCEAKGRSAGQEIPQLLRISERHCRVYKSPLLEPRLGQLNPANTPMSYIFSIYFNIVRNNPLQFEIPLIFLNL